MSNVRPNVFQKNVDVEKNIPEQKPENQLPKISTDEDYETKKMVIANQIYSEYVNQTNNQAIEEMRKRTEEQIKLRNLQLEKNSQEANKNNKPDVPAYVEPIQKTILTSEIKSPITKENNLQEKMELHNSKIEEISQPQFNLSFDLIPLPSEGKIYKNVKSNVKVAYMTAADENILTSPNLLKSGEFLEVLINRKLLEKNIRYKDLHTGDRNAIMLWLRATAYGEMYPVILFDKDDNPFEAEVDLTNLKFKKLGAEPDEEGLFDFTLPVSKSEIKFKFLSVGDLDEIERLIEKDSKEEALINNSNTYALERQIVEVNGNRDKLFIKEFIESMRLPDSKALKNYINKIESGVDLEIEVTAPGGESIKSFLPLNRNFFWPDESI